MGNCLFGGLGPDVDHVEGQGVLTKVITSTGGVMEFYAPITAGSITDEFPGHGIFRNQDLFWKALPYHEDLVAGESYYLLPLSTHPGSIAFGKCGQFVREGHVRSNSIPTATGVPPYRMSVDHRGTLKRTYTDVFSRHGNSGSNDGGRMWKVRLVICPEQLMDILSHESRTEELVESMRAVAKCGAGGGPMSTMSTSSSGFSDQWSLSSSRNASTNKTDGLLVDI